MNFQYQAVTKAGSKTSGLIEATDRRAALRLLSDRGLYPSNLSEAHGKSDYDKHQKKNPKKGNNSSLSSGVKSKEITGFTRELAALLDAGIPVMQALSSIAEEATNPTLRAVLCEVTEDIKHGASFSEALSKKPKYFTNLFVSMVRVGEEAGVLDSALNDLADLMEHEDEMRGEVVSAISYPAFVLVFGLVTVILLLSFVMPRLFGMLEEMMDILPLPTLILLNVSSFIKSYWFWIIGVLIGVGLPSVRYLRSPAGLYFIDRMKLKSPLIGPVFESAALSRFARTLGTLTRSGVSLLPALQIVEHTIGNRVLAEVLASVAEDTRGGDSLAAPLKKSGIFPSSIIQMISVGEESGKLDKMLLKVAKIEERHMRSRSKTLVSLLAPALILGIGALIGFIVIALLLPIFKMSQSIN